MSIKTQQVHHNVDLMGLLLLNWGLQPLTADPASTFARLYYNSTTGKIRMYNTVSSQWEDLASGQSISVDAEQVQDITAAMFGGTQNGVSVTYNDDNGTLTLAVTDSPSLNGFEGGYYLDRGNHTGTQAIGTVTGLQTALDDKADDADVTALDGRLDSAELTLGGLGTAATADAVDFDAAGAATAAQAFAVQRANHTGTQSADTIVDGTTNHVFTVADDTKLGGIAAGATANATDAQLRDRSTHTGTQLSTTISDLAETVRDTIGATLVAGNNIDITVNDGADTITIDVEGLTSADITDMLEAVQDITGGQFTGNVLSGLTTTYNDTSGKVDVTVTNSPQLGGQNGAYYLSRTNHTGSQASTTISDFVEAAQDATGAMVIGNTETGITVTYDDATNKINFTVTDSPLLGGQNSAYHLARVNHTGTQLAATISDLNTAVGNIVATLTIDADTLQGDTVSDIVTAAVNQITGGAGAAYDTLIEIQNFLQDQDTDIATLMSNIATKAGRYSVTVGDGTLEDFVVTHNLGTRDVDVICTGAAAPYAQHSVYWEATTTNTVTVFFPTAPTASQYRITVLG